MENPFKLSMITSKARKMASDYINYGVEPDIDYFGELITENGNRDYGNAPAEMKLSMLGADVKVNQQLPKGQAGVQDELNVPSMYDKLKMSDNPVAKQVVDVVEFAKGNYYNYKKASLPSKEMERLEKSAAIPLGVAEAMTFGLAPDTEASEYFKKKHGVGVNLGATATGAAIFPLKYLLTFAGVQATENYILYPAIDYYKSRMAELPSSDLPYKNYREGSSVSLTDLADIPEENEKTRTALNTFEFVANAMITHGIVTKAPKMWKNATKRLVTEQYLPEKFKYSGEEFKALPTDSANPKDITQRTVLKDVFQKKNITIKDLRNARQNGIEIPAETIIKLVDKPWWGTLKSKLKAVATGEAGTINEQGVFGGKSDMSKAQPLIEQAKQYKTAEEFVASQKIVYHGTNKNFKIFKKTHGDLGEGIYFTPDVGSAQKFAYGKRVTQGGKDTIISAELDVKNPLEIGVGEDGKKALQFYKAHQYTQISKLAKEKGYDSIYRSIGDEGVEWLVFDNNNIKRTGIHQDREGSSAYQFNMKRKKQLTDIWKQANAVQPTENIDYAKRPDGTLKTKSEYTPEEWDKYTESVINQKLKTEKTTEPIDAKIKSGEQLINLNNPKEKVYFNKVDEYKGEKRVYLDYIFNDRGKLRQDTRYVKLEDFDNIYKKGTESLRKKIIKTRNQELKKTAIFEMKDIKQIAKELTETENPTGGGQVPPTNPPTSLATPSQPEPEGQKPKVTREFISGRKQGRELQIEKEKSAKDILDRRRARIKAIRDYYGLSDNDMKKVSKKDIRLMNNYEFKQFKDDLDARASQFAELKQKKNEIVDLINRKNFTRLENLRKALALPNIKNMTMDQLNQYGEIIESYQEGDDFLTQRELETVENTDLKGIRTTREAREKLAKRLGVSVDKLDNIKVSELDNFRWDTSLAERNPFYKMMVETTNKHLLGGEAEYLKIEDETYRLAKLANKSRNKGIIDKLIPQNKLIMDYLESPLEGKAKLREQMTPEEIDYAHYIEQQFQQALEYLIESKTLTKGRENYFTHIRMGLLESIKEDGIVQAFKNIFKKYQQDEMVFNILDEDTSNILPLEKFFQFSLQRTGNLNPSKNVTASFLAYMKTLKKKQALDKMIPELDIYAQSLTPKQLTPRGLEVDRSLKKFVNRWINNKKGRRAGMLIAKQNGVIDMSLRAANLFVSVFDLGFSLPTGIAATVGEQMMTYQSLGKIAYAKGVTRMNTAKGKRILDKYKNLIGKSIWGELTEADKPIGERLMQAMFGFFHQSSVWGNKVHVMGSLTPQELQTETISIERLAELKIDMGRWRDMQGAKSIVGSTSIGSTINKYKGWAIPIMRTTIKDLTTVASKFKNKGAGEAFTSKEAKELYRAIEMSSILLILGAKVIGEADDDSFIGKLRAKAYRESMTFLQGIDPRIFLSTPRIATFAYTLADNLVSIAKLEEYKSSGYWGKEGDLKGVAGLKRQFTPAIVKQFSTKKPGGTGNPFKKGSSGSNKNPFKK